MTEETLFKSTSTQNDNPDVVGGDPSLNQHQDTGEDPREINYMEELVGEGRKYKTQDDLAKGAYHSQIHIQRLEAEQQALREDLAKRLTLEEAVAKMTERTKELSTLDGNNQSKDDNLVPLTDSGSGRDNEANQHEGLSQEEILQLVQSQIEQREQSRTKETNLSKVQSELQKVWGNNYVNTLNNKAQELGVGQDFLDKLASEHPKAFLELVGAKQSPSKPPPTPPVSSQNTSPLTGTHTGNTRNQAYYSKMRKDNPNLYWDAKTQMQMHEDASSLGEGFYNR